MTKEARPYQGTMGTVTLSRKKASGPTSFLGSHSSMDGGFPRRQVSLAPKAWPPLSSCWLDPTTGIPHTVPSKQTPPSRLLPLTSPCRLLVHYVSIYSASNPSAHLFKKPFYLWTFSNFHRSRKKTILCLMGLSPKLNT